MEIQNETYNKLLKRKEIQGVIKADSNPGFEQVRQAIAKLSKTDVEKIAIKYLKNNFGSDEFMVEAFLYDSKELKESVEQKQKAKKSGAGQ